jgi:hypothetical protein
MAYPPRTTVLSFAWYANPNRLEVVHVGVDRLPIAVAGKLQPPADAERAGGDLGNRIGRIGGLGGVRDVQRRVGVEPAHVAVEALDRRGFVFPAQAKIHRQFAGQLPIVLEEQAVVEHLVESVGAAIDRSPARKAQDECREILADGGGR